MIQYKYCRYKVKPSKMHKCVITFSLENEDHDELNKTINLSMKLNSSLNENYIWYMIQYGTK